MIMMHSKRAFTLMEIIVAFTLVGVIAGIGYVQFSDTLKRAEQNDALLRLRAIKGAIDAYTAKTGDFWNPPSTTYNLDQFNAEHATSFQVPEGINFGYEPYGAFYSVGFGFPNASPPYSFYYVSNQGYCCYAASGSGWCHNVPDCN